MECAESRGSVSTLAGPSQPTLHKCLDERRVHRIDTRRELSCSTPETAKPHLIEVASGLLPFEDIPEALGFRQGKHLAEAEAALGGTSPEPESPTPADPTPAQV